MKVDFKDRHEYLGASETAAAIGLGTYETVTDVWQEKTLRRGRKEHLPIFDRGHDIEDILERLLKERHGIEVRMREKEFAKEEWLRSHVDGMVDPHDPICDTDVEMDGPGVVEFKAPGSTMLRRLLEGGMSNEYVVQMQVNLYNSDLSWGVFFMLDYDRYEVTAVYVRRDDALIEGILKRARLFWEFVKQDVHPPEATPEELSTFVLSDREVDIEGYEGVVSSYADAISEAEGLKVRIEGLKDQFRGALTKADASSAVVAGHDGMRAKVSWKETKPRETFDGKALWRWAVDLAEAVDADDLGKAKKMAQRILTEEGLFVKTGASSRPLRITIKDGES
jgi:predicted phage-related endonuclease